VFHVGQVLASKSVSVSDGVFSWILKDWHSSDNKKRENVKKRKAKQASGLKILSHGGADAGKDFKEASTLKGITFEVKRGELVAIVGAVGSGKSSLLLALLGEMEVMYTKHFIRIFQEFLDTLIKRILSMGRSPSRSPFVHNNHIKVSL